MIANKNRNQTARLLDQHVQRLLACRQCPEMRKPVVSGGAVVSRVMLVGQAPGDKEPVLGRPLRGRRGKLCFAGSTKPLEWRKPLFVRQSTWPLSAVVFPAKIPLAAIAFPRPMKCKSVPRVDEKQKSKSSNPRPVIPVGKLAIEQFMPLQKLDTIIGRQFEVKYAGHAFDLIPLPHPSGASPWHRMEPGKTLLQGAMKLIVKHPVHCQELMAEPSCR